MAGRGAALVLLIVLVAPALAGCGYADPSPPAPTGVPVTPGSTPPPSGTPGSSSPTPAPDDPRVQAALDLLVTDEGFTRDEIEVVSVEVVTWPNAALGCPATGSSPDPTPVAGYRIVLGVGDRTFVYHGATDGDPFRCQFLD